MAISPLPTPPSRDDPANFAARGDAFLGALPDFATELNDALPTINEAIPASEIAVALVNYKGDYNSATTYLVGQSVTYNGTRFLSKKTNLNITPVDGADWYELAAGAETVVRSILNQSSAITLLASDGGGYLLVSGTTGINLNLPDATTLVGRTFVIKNLGTYPMFVYNSAGTYLFNLNGNQTSAIWASDISTSAGEWSIQEFPAPYADSILTFGSVNNPNVNSLQPVARLSSTKQLVVFNQLIQDSNRIYGVIVTNSAGSITVGQPQLISTIDGVGCAAVGLSATSAIVSWRGASQTTWYACAISLSGDVITAGTPITIASNLTDKIKFSYLTATTAVIAGYTSTSQLSAGVCTVSGTTLTCGTLTDIGTPQVVSSTFNYGLCSLSATLCLSHAAGGGSNNGHARTLSISGTTITANSTVSSGVASSNGNSDLSCSGSTQGSLVYIDVTNQELRVRTITVSGTTPTFQTPVTVLNNTNYTANNGYMCGIMHISLTAGYINTTIATTSGDRIFGFTKSTYAYTIGSAISPTTGSSATTAFRQLQNFSSPNVGAESATYTTFHTPLNVGNLQSLTLSGTTATATTRVAVGARYIVGESTGHVSAISANRAIVLVGKYINGSDSALYAHLIDYTNATPVIISTQLLTSGFPLSGSYSSVALTTTKILITWNQTSYNIHSAVLTISGDTLSLGSDLTVDAGDGSGNNWHSITRLSDTSALFAFSYRTAAYPTAIVLSVSGTTVSAGTSVMLNTSFSTERQDCVALDSTTAIVAYEVNSSYVALLTISGTTITIQQNSRSYLGDQRPSLTSLSSTKFIVSNGNSALGGMTVARVCQVANNGISFSPRVYLPSRYGSIKFVATSADKGFAYDDYINSAYSFTIDSSNCISIGDMTTMESPRSGSLLQANSVIPNASKFAYIGYDTFKAFTGKIYSLGAIK